MSFKSAEGISLAEYSYMYVLQLISTVTLTYNLRNQILQTFLTVLCRAICHVMLAMLHILIAIATYIVNSFESL